jgi:NAD(P)-dependent dehydrogenase (short-subunit alcohol dehydrogenase family)
MTDRSVLITGASGALGSAVAAAFVADGWRVVAPTRGKRDLGEGILTVPEAELTDLEAVSEVAAIASADPGRPLGALVNLVGGFASAGRVHETPLADFEAQFGVNLHPTYLVTQAVLPALIAAGGGGIVCVSSRAALAPFPGAAGYIASKAALIAFAQTVAVEYRADGVRCNAVVPTVIDTPANRAAQPNADHSKWTAPEAIAKVIRFLAGPDSTATTGATIPV